MNYSSILLALFSICIFVSSVSSAPFIRFINALEGQTITISTDRFAPITLNYQEATSYSAVSEGSVSVSSVTTSTDPTNLNPTTISITFDFYATVACVQADVGFRMVLFNETAPAIMNNDNTADRAWIRFIDLGAGVQFLNLNTNTGTLFSYVGFLESTAFAPVNTASTSTLTVVESGTSNSYPVSLTSAGGSISQSNAYTVFFFTPASGNNGVAYLDRVLSSSPSASSTSSSAASSSTPSSSSGGQHSNPEDSDSNSSATKTIVGLSILFFTLLVL